LDFANNIAAVRTAVESAGLIIIEDNWEGLEAAK
jgi:DNA-binding FrmR family transcriptional regulator